VFAFYTVEIKAVITSAVLFTCVALNLTLGVNGKKSMFQVEFDVDKISIMMYILNLCVHCCIVIALRIVLRR